MKTMTIAGRVLDVAGLIPLKVRDWRLLKEQGLTQEMMWDTSLSVLERVDVVIKVALFVAQKVDPSVTAAMFEDLTTNEVLKLLQGEEEKAADPTSSALSTSSPKPTAGQSETAKSAPGQN